MGGFLVFGRRGERRTYYKKEALFLFPELELFLLGRVYYDVLSS